MPRTDIRIADGEKNRITEVVLFPDQAYVTRQATAAVEAGKQRLLLEIQALHIDTDSIQSRVFGRGVLLGVQYRRLPVVHAPQQELRELDNRLRQLQLNRRRISDARQIVEKQRKFLDTTLSYAEVEVPREIKTRFPSASQMGEMIEFMDHHYHRLAERHDKLTIELEDMDNEIEALEQQVKKGKRREHNIQGTIELLFDSAEPQLLRIEASYGVFQANWTPFYTADVAEDLSKLTLHQFARIRQNSGEAWTNVQLSLSSAEPLRGADLPEPQSWILRKPEPIYLPCAAPVCAAPMVMPASDAVDADTCTAEEALEETAPVEMAKAQRKVLPSAFEYPFPLPVDIPSADDDTLLSLTSRDAEGRFYHHAAPRIDPHCHLVCETAGDPELPPGQLNIHFGGRFVASTRLNEQSAGEPLRFNLGIDRSVRVKRETLVDKTAETFFRLMDRSHTARELKYRIRVENLRQEPIDMVLFDNVPIASNDRYLVKGIELNPEPTERDWQKQEGVMQWRMILPPQASEEISIHFFIKYPREERPEGI